MNLTVPGVGTEAGPDWATEINADLSVLDGHNHATGSGVQINPSGLNINADLPFGTNNATGLRSTRFVSQVSPLSGASDLGCVYVSGAELYYNDESGNQVKLTSGGTVNATSSGISSGTATAAFSASTLVVNANVNTPANIQVASVLLGNNVASSNYLTLSPPNAMAASYSLTLPNVPVGATAFVTLDTAGNFGSSVSTVGGIVTGNIANAAITSGKLASNLAVTGTFQINSLNAVTSNTNATSALSIVRGMIDSSGTLITGEGFSYTIGASGFTAFDLFTVTFTTAFTDIPAITFAGGNNIPAALGTTVLLSFSSSGFSCLAPAPGGGNVGYLSFIAMGQV
jgi:hypothetical protein